MDLIDEIYLVGLVEGILQEFILVMLGCGSIDLGSKLSNESLRAIGLV